MWPSGATQSHARGLIIIVALCLSMLILTTIFEA